MADLYLVHWPVKLNPGAVNLLPSEGDFDELDLETTWFGMEKSLEMGLCRCIGVSNFSSKKIQQLVHFASVPPVVNQVEMHRMWRQRKLREVCQKHDIHVSAYSPLGAPGNFWGSNAVLDHPTLKSIARKHNATSAQFALAWGLAEGSIVIVKSFDQRRMKENIAALQLTLDDSDILKVQNIEEQKMMREEVFVNEKTSPYKTVQDLWNDEI
ncbi:hypothetical protein ACH5RR_016986 [Cinchona calisaya]|uniref:NADP-dependent oxidoreductase domain-containing protein n=1 Tax=Cinchona calisaya TaxID=153742 RepID=A0ABD3A075_9GENT